MSGLALSIVRGGDVSRLVASGRAMAVHQQRLIVQLPTPGHIGVLDASRDVLVLFDAAALVALADAEILASSQADVDADTYAVSDASPNAIAGPPSRL